MNSQTHPSSTGDVVLGAAEALAGVAIGTAVLFPLAIPCLILTLAAVVLLVLPVAVIGVIAAVPVMAVRAVFRRRAADDHRGPSENVRRAAGFTECHDRSSHAVAEV